MPAGPTPRTPNPVVLLAGIFGTARGSFSGLIAFLTARGYRVYAKAYGATIPGLPKVSDLERPSESAEEIAAWIKEVHTRTGAARVDLVGYSEGGYMALYVPKFADGAAALLDHVVGVAPPAHGPVVQDLAADERPIAQAGNRLSVIYSAYDEVVRPAFARVEEEGVANVRVQDYCPRDLTGHIGISSDSNFWNLLVNEQEGQHGREFKCSAGGHPL